MSLPASDHSGSDRSGSASGGFEHNRARRMWRALEPYHAVTYFAPESKAATDAMGCKGGWMSYFGLRAAPLGRVPAGVVTALFYNFHPDRVARALPGAWAVAEPERFLDVRLSSIDEALRRLLGDAVASDELAEAAELAGEAAMAAPTAGRALAAANAALDWPTEPHLALWHAQTVLRESRGDGHNAALVAAGLDPCEALVVFAADGFVGAEPLRDWRGWSTVEWSSAAGRLVARGLLDPAGALTEHGAEVRAWVEECTDSGAMTSWDALGERRCDRLLEVAGPLVRMIVEGGGFLDGNPMGLRPLP